MKSLLKLTWMEAKLFMREPVSAFFTLIFPLMMLFIFGVISGKAPSPLPDGRSLLDSLVPALTAMVIGTSGLMATTITMATYRENGILRRLQTTPVSPLMVLVAQVIVVFCMMCLGMLLLAAVGGLVYHLRMPSNPLGVLAGFMLSSLSFSALGFILAGLLPTARAAQVVGLMLLYPMLILSGAAGFPREVLPDAAQKAANFLPLTYVVNLLSGLWAGDAWGAHLTDVLVLAAVLLVGVLVSVRTFRWE